MISISGQACVSHVVQAKLDPHSVVQAKLDPVLLVQAKLDPTSVVQAKLDPTKFGSSRPSGERRDDLDVYMRTSSVKPRWLANRWKNGVQSAVVNHSCICVPSGPAPSPLCASNVNASRMPFFVI